MEKEIVSYIVEGIKTNHSLPDVNVIHPAGGAFFKIKKLKTLMNTYWMLCDAIHQANECYGDQLMAVIFSAFIHITIKFYFLFLNVATGKVLLIISEGAWILTYICFLVVLVNSSTDITISMAGAVTTYLVILIQFQVPPTST
ncbi:hypothetical protein J6590_053350 [Homalodisca vitripennis]|nr:hypothetical protein J6590_053350 [Homalodisca vitripennis]